VWLYLYILTTVYTHVGIYKFLYVNERNQYLNTLTLIYVKLTVCKLIKLNTV